MILMDVRADNFYAFKDFHINFSYPKKIVGSTIEGEFLPEKTNFRYKKLVILMGANATGKSSLGKLLMNIFNFIDKKEVTKLTDVIQDPAKDASFSVDFVIAQETLYRVSGRITPPENENYKSTDIRVKVESAVIRKRDSYETCLEQLSENPETASKSYVEKLDQVNGMSWMFAFPMTTDNLTKAYKPINEARYVEILKNTLRALDPRIKDVFPFPKRDNTYVVEYENQPVFIAEGKVLGAEMMSSGTIEGIGVANIIAAIKTGAYGFMYCDEKFSHIHGESERAFLSLLVECLGDEEQLMVTTHNTDLLDMDLPKHAFVFLRRKYYGEDGYILDCVSASDYLKRSTDSIRSAVENDLFAASPDLETIYKLVEV